MRSRWSVLRIDPGGSLDLSTWCQGLPSAPPALPFTQLWIIFRLTMNQIMLNRFNRISITRVGIVWLALLPALAQSTGLHSQGVRTRKISESGLRRLANKVVLPEFPRDAIRARKAGVAVAFLDINERGAVVKVETLEAPSPSIGAALSRALSHWSFTPPLAEDIPMKMHGKLTFYFLFQNGKPVVLRPDEAPFVGCQGSSCR